MGRCTKPMMIRDIHGRPQYVPCGMCKDCRLEKAGQWAARCIHEAQMYDENCFLTLTYAPEHLPKDGSVHKKHLSDFMRKLRRSFELPGWYPSLDAAGRLQWYKSRRKKYLDQNGNPKCKVKKGYSREVRFFACGEYGEKLGRPHYHLILFNYDFPDKEIMRGGQLKWTKTHFERGNVHALYISKSLSTLWGKGFCTIGEVTFDSAGYVARYVMKKVTGDIDLQADYYNGKNPEFCLMSRMPGIGMPWLKKYYKDVYPKDYFTINGHRKRPSRYYDDFLQKYHPILYGKVMKARKEKAVKANCLNPQFVRGLWQECGICEKCLERAERGPAKRKYTELITKPLKRSLENE